DRHWRVEKPPAAEGHQAPEFARRDAQLVLVFAAQHRHEEAVVREALAEVRDGADVGLAYAVARLAERGVHPPLRADHHGEREAALAADREDDLLEHRLALPEGRIARPRWVRKSRREADRQVDGAHAIDPLAQKTP